MHACKTQSDGWNRDQGLQTKKVCKDQWQPQSQKHVHPSKNNLSQHHWEQGPIAIPTHTKCRSFPQSAATEVLVIAMLIVQGLISHFLTLSASEYNNNLKPCRQLIPQEISQVSVDISNMNIHTYNNLVLISTYKLQKNHYSQPHSGFKVLTKIKIHEWASNVHKIII